MRLRKSLFFLTIVLKLSMQTENYEIIKLVNDFIVKLNNPVKVSAYICWSKDDSLLLWKELSRNSLASQIVKTGNNVCFSYAFPIEHQVFLLDANCSGSNKILERAKQLNLFNQPYRWIVWGQADYNLFKELYFRLDSQVFVIEKPEKLENNDENNYHIKSLYKLSEDSTEFMENTLSAWNLKEGFLMYKELSISRNRTDLMGMNLNISYVVTDPDTYKHLEDYRNPHIDITPKLNWIMMKHLLLMLNATSTPMFQTTWGYRQGNTSRFNGMIGDLQSEMAEIGGTALFFTIDRVDIIEYITPSGPTYMKFIFRAPPVSYVSNVFTLPFDAYVWYCCFGLIPITFAVVYFIVKWEWRNPVFKEKLEKTRSNSIMPVRPRFFDVMMMELSAITQQGTDTEPKSSAGQIAIVFVFTATMFLYTAYSANIVAILQSTTDSIKTLEDLLQSRIALGVEDIVYAHYYFKTAEEPVRKAIYQQKVSPKGQKPNFMTIQEGISRVQKEFFAFHVEVSSGYKMVGDTFHESEKCGLKEIDFINVIEPWLSIKKKSAYKEVVKVGLRRMLESGIQRRHINLIYTKKPVCHSKRSSFGSAAILDCYAAFLLYGVGVAFSLIFLFCEILIYKKIKKRDRILCCTSTY